LSLRGAGPIRTVFAPTWASASAAAVPAGPAPTTATSRDFGTTNSNLMRTGRGNFSRTLEICKLAATSGPGPGPGVGSYLGAANNLQAAEMSRRPAHCGCESGRRNWKIVEGPCPELTSWLPAVCRHIVAHQANRAGGPADVFISGRPRLRWTTFAARLLMDPRSRFNLLANRFVLNAPRPVEGLERLRPRVIWRIEGIAPGRNLRCSIRSLE
jgi:hypothetical protein